MILCYSRVKVLIGQDQEKGWRIFMTFDGARDCECWRCVSFKATESDVMTKWEEAEKELLNAIPFCSNYYIEWEHGPNDIFKEMKETIVAKLVYGNMLLHLQC